MIFYNSEGHIHKPLFIKVINELTDIEICLVNNNSLDTTYYQLRDIKEACSNVSLINIKIKTSETNAIKAGARFMINEFDLNSLGYITMNSIHSKFNSIHEIVKAIRRYKDALKNKNPYMLKPYENKQLLMKKIYSVTDCILQLQNITTTDSYLIFK